MFLGVKQACLYVFVQDDERAYAELPGEAGAAAGVARRARTGV